MHPRPGSFGSHGHRIDPVIVPLSAKCLNSKMVKHCALTKINSVIVPQSAKCLKRKMVKHCALTHVGIFGHFTHPYKFFSIVRNKEILMSNTCFRFRLYQMGNSVVVPKSSCNGVNGKVRNPPHKKKIRSLYTFSHIVNRSVYSKKTSSELSETV